MQREILFRGKEIDNSRWVIGSLFFDDDREPWIIPQNDLIENVSIKSGTVGQYTGLTDKNGKKIFEGDILKYVNEDDENHYIKVVFEECAFLIEDNEIIDSALLTSYTCLGIEVAGNIYDNPELLEVSK